MKNTHGGKRKNAGRKKGNFKTSAIKLSFKTTEEKKTILKLSPRERTQVLLNYYKLTH